MRNRLHINSIFVGAVTLLVNLYEITNPEIKNTNGTRYVIDIKLPFGNITNSRNGSEAITTAKFSFGTLYFLRTRIKALYPLTI